MPVYTLDDGITLKNKLGAASHGALEIAEADYVSNRLLRTEPGHGPTGQFDAAHLRAIHRHLFQDVYEWSGRTGDERVALSDGTIASEPSLRKTDGSAFMAGSLIPQALDRIAGSLRAANYLRGLSREEFARHAADVMVDLNNVHPFREGNGRTQRAFLRALATEAGHELDFSVISRERMVQASIAGKDLYDNAMMRRMFDEISDPVRVAALEKTIEALSQHKFPWNDKYLATSKPGHKIEVTMAGVSGDQFMARTRGSILIGQTSDLPAPPPRSGDAFTLEPSVWRRAGDT